VLKHVQDTISARKDSQLANLENQDPNNKARQEAVNESWETARNRLAAMQNKIYDLGTNDFLFGLHLWDEQSVSHLHLHIIAKSPELLIFSTREHDVKTVDAEEVQRYIEGTLCSHISNTLG
jgi:diadenosine tetraphosphate (Ap4A) HIT family hydrolase